MRRPADIAWRFSASAATYDRHAAVQRAVAERLSRLLPDSAPGRVLEIGCGTGIMTGHLLGRYPDAPVDAIDFSEGMIQHCRSRWSGEKRVAWKAVDLLRFEPEHKYPLVVSSAALHWVRPMSDTFGKVAGLLKPGGALVIAVMVLGTLAELMEARARVAPRKPPAFTLPSEKEVRGALAASGLRVCEECGDCVRAEYADANSMLRALHEQGLTGGRAARGARLLTRCELRALAKDYAEHYSANGFVFATFSVYYARAYKG